MARTPQPGPTASAAQTPEPIKPSLKRVLSSEEFLPLAREVRENRATLLGFDRLYVLWEAVRNVAPLGLAAAEIGTYRGGSAFFIAGAFRALQGEDVELHVFDTFAGHAAGTSATGDLEEHHPEGHFGDTSVEAVSAYLAEYENVQLHVGNVLETMHAVGDAQLSLVHIDVDLQLVTAESLEFFGGLVPAGGVIVVDDYGAAKCPGVEVAVQEYLRSPPGGRFQFWRIAPEQALLIATS